MASACADRTPSEAIILTSTDVSALISHGRWVVEREAEALAALAATIDDRFAQAATLLLETRGRIVVSGMGKSGHVARKIAATFASTGAPAQFVHPAEAAHGDLGMLAAGDCLLLLSNSGHTTELRPLVERARALGVPVVAITGEPGSALMRLADVRLPLPPLDEACPVKLVPTTSTVMMMALGDALAMALMRTRRVSREGYKALHPGGAIGARLLPLSVVMHGPEGMPLVALAMPMREVIVTMTTRSFGVAGVTDAAGTLCGIITDGDLRRHVDDLLVSTAADVMTPDPVVIGEEARVEEALALMDRHRITSLFVTRAADPRRPVGLVHVHDFLRLGVA